MTLIEYPPQLATRDARDLLSRIEQIAVDKSGCEVKLVVPGGEEIVLPASLLKVLQEAARAFSEGESVAIVPIQGELTTQEAADFLNVSRQYLVEILERGDIPFVKVGTHRRVKFRDLAAYKERRDAERRQKLRELTQLSQDLGLYSTAS